MAGRVFETLALYSHQNEKCFWQKLYREEWYFMHLSFAFLNNLTKRNGRYRIVMIFVHWACHNLAFFAFFSPSRPSCWTRCHLNKFSSENPTSVFPISVIISLFATHSLTYARCPVDSRRCEYWNFDVALIFDKFQCIVLCPQSARLMFARRWSFILLSCELWRRTVW